mgnify:CR=1 FL=1
MSGDFPTFDIGYNEIDIVGKNLAKTTNANSSSTGYSLNIQDGLISITTTGTENAFDLCNGTKTGTYLPNYASANDYHLTPANQGEYKLSISNVSLNVCKYSHSPLKIALLLNL